MNINHHKKLDPAKSELYLKMIAESVGFLSYNKGASRKEIWKYVMKNFRKTDYQTFLLSINQLLQDGKMTRNDNGYYFIAEDVYREMNQLYIEGKKSQGKMSTGGKGSSKGSVGGLPVNNLRKMNSIDNFIRKYGQGHSSNGKNYCGSYDKFPAKKNSGGKISQISTKINSSYRKIQESGSRSHCPRSNVLPQDTDIEQFVIEIPGKNFKDHSQNGGIVPDVNTDPMEEISKKIMEELQKEYPDRKKGKTGNVTPCIMEEKGPGAKMPDSKKRKEQSKNLLGFQQASAEFSQELSNDGKLKKDHEKKQERIDLIPDELDQVMEENTKVVSKQHKKEKDEKTLFGLTSPSKSDETDARKSQKSKQKVVYQELATPEDLYPKKKEKEAVQFNVDQKIDDLNSDSDDERIREDLSQGPESSNIRQARRTGRRRQDMDNYSQVSVVSKYSLRPRGEQSRMSQNNIHQKQTKKHSDHKKKVQEKQDRKERSSRKNKEFKTPHVFGGDKQRSAEKIDLNMLSGENDLSDQSNVTVSGFGAYKTRNYSCFQAVTSKALTRNKLTEVISNKPHLEKILDQFHIQNENPRTHQVKNSQNYSQVGQKRSHNEVRNFSTIEKHKAGSMSKIQKTGLQSTKKVEGFQSQSHYTNYNGRSSRNVESASIQRKKMMIHQRVQQENIAKRSTFSVPKIKPISGQQIKKTVQQSQQATQGQNQKPSQHAKISPKKQNENQVPPIVISKPKVVEMMVTPKKESKDNQMSQMSTRSRRSPRQETPLQKETQQFNTKEDEFCTQSGRQTTKQNYRDANKQGYQVQSQAQYLMPKPQLGNLTAQKICQIASLYAKAQPAAPVIVQRPPLEGIPRPVGPTGVVKAETQSQSTSVSGQQSFEQGSLISPQKRGHRFRNQHRNPRDIVRNSQKQNQMI